MTLRSGLYVYGIVGKDTEYPKILGIDKQNTIYPLEGKDICVMVSKIGIDQFQSQVKMLHMELAKNIVAPQNGSEEILQIHEAVVEGIMKNTTIVPFKFGTILNDEKAAAKLLQDNEEDFKRILAKLIGKLEWGLKIFVDKKEFTKNVVRNEDESKIEKKRFEKLPRGVNYLLARKMEEAAKDNVFTQLANISKTLFQELGKVAYEAILNKTLPQKMIGGNKEMILNAAYLVEKENVASFCKQGERLTEEYKLIGLDLNISGPWPPYSFT